MIGKTARQGAAKKAILNWAEKISGDPGLMKAVECAAKFAGGWILSKAVIFGDKAPFSSGFAAVAGGGLGGFFSLIGIVAGSLSGGADMLIKYSAVALLIFAANTVLKGSKFSLSRWFAPAIAALMMACTGGVYAANGGWQFEQTVLYIAEIVLAGGSACFYGAALREEISAEHKYRRMISLTAAVCTVMIALSDITILGMISLGRVLAVIVVLAAAYKGGASAAAALGVAFGAAADAAAGSMPFFCAAFGMAGTAAGLFRSGSRLVSAAIYILLNAAAVMCFGGGQAAISSLYETFIASVAFVLLPEQLLLSARESVAVQLRRYRGEEKAREYARKKAMLASEAFAAAYELLDIKDLNKNDRNANISVVFDAVADSKCAACGDRERCYGREYEATRTAQNDASARMMLRGTLLSEDFPEHFRYSCRDIEGLSKMVNEEYTKLRKRRERMTHAGEKYELLCGRFMDMADAFADFAEQLTPTGGVEKECEERINMYLRGKNLDIRAAVFRDGNKRMHIELEGDGVAALKKMPDWLDKLGAAAQKSLCEVESEGGSRHILLLEAEPLAVRIGVVSMRRSGEAVNGDKGAYFKTDSGLLYVILSDGMGSGEGAAEDSGEVIALLEKFLRAGMNAESAMRLVGAAMQLKNDRELSSASVDMLCVNLFTGKTDIFKFGAAPTFIKTGQGVEVHKGSSLSAGLRGSSENQPDHLPTRLEAGSTAVIVSDGVTGGEAADWIRDALESEERPGKEFARRILEEAGKRHGCSDDMTVITVNMDRR